MKILLTNAMFAAVLAVSGNAFAQEAVTGEDASETEMNSPSMLIAGCVTAGVGTLAIGAAFLIVPQVYGDEEDGMAGTWVGYGTLAAGGLHVLVGVPLIIAGAWQIPVDDQAAVSVGPSGATFRTAF